MEDYDYEDAHADRFHDYEEDAMQYDNEEDMPGYFDVNGERVSEEEYWNQYPDDWYGGEEYKD